jgi:hypothetical protein
MTRKAVRRKKRTGSDEPIKAYSGLSEDDKWKEISRALISDAVRRVHGPGVGCISKDSDVEAPRMPVYDDKLEPKATRYWQLGAIYENEGTIAGTYRAHEQFGLSPQKSATPAAATAPDSTTPPSPAAPLATAVSDTQHPTHSRLTSKMRVDPV